MKCKECECARFMKGNGNPNRYYCSHPKLRDEFGVPVKMICRTERHSKELTIKTSPRWCPLKGEKK